MSEKKRFYVYVLSKPDGTPCYVGKGQRRRVKHHEMRGESHANPILAATFKKYGSLPHKIVFRTDDEQEAFKEEIRLIALYGRKNKNTGTLCNLTDGGDGLTGWVPSQETRDKISAANTGRKHSDETRARMSASGKGRILSEEHKRKIRDAQKGKVISPETIEKMRKTKLINGSSNSEKLKAYHANMTEEQKAERARRISERTKVAMKRPEVKERTGKGWVGKTQSEEHKEKNRQAQIRSFETNPERWEAFKALTPMLGKKHSDETKAKIGKANSGRVPTEEQRRKIGEAQKGRKASPETLAKRSASLKGRIVSEETREKLRQANLGRVHSDETKAKMRTARAARSAARKE